MYKIKLIILFLLLCFVFFSCTMNEQTGLIIIINYSEAPFAYFSLNNTTLCNNILSGSNIDYWFFSSFSGFVNADSDYIYIAESYDNDNNKIKFTDKKRCTFKPGYKYTIEIRSVQVPGSNLAYESIRQLFIYPGIKYGADTTSSDYYHFP